MAGLKLLSAKLHNFAGIKAGMGTNTLEVDFEKMLNNICLVIGGNGSGKTTFLESLHPKAYNVSEARNSNSYNLIVDGKDGHKELIYQVLGEDVKYKILHHYEYTKRGRRVKSYLTKYIGDDVIELNPNGNVTSFNSTLEIEMGFNDTQLELVRLGKNMRGLVDKPSTERKKYVGELLHKLKIYTHYHKIVNAKYRLVKSDLKSISDKISKLRYSDEDEIRDIMEKYENNLEVLEDDVYKTKSKIDTLKRSREDMNYIEELYISIREEFSEIKSEISKLENKIGKLEYIDDIYELTDGRSNMEALNEINSLCSEDRVNLALSKDKRNNILERVQELERELDVEIDYSDGDSIFRELEKYENLLDEVNKELEYYETEYKFSPKSRLKLDKSQLLLCKEYTNTISDMVAGYFSDLDYNLLEQYCQALEDGLLENLQKSYSESYDEDLRLRAKLKKLEGEYSSYVDKKKFGDILRSRPSNCDIDDCPFISEALKYSDVEEKLDKLEDKINRVRNSIAMNNISLQNFILISELDSDMDTVITFIKSHKDVLKILPRYDGFKSKKKFAEIVAHSNIEYLTEGLDQMLDEIEEFSRYQELLNLKKPELERDYRTLRDEAEEYKKNSKVTSEIERLNLEVVNINKSIVKLEQKVLYRDKIKADLEVYIELKGELDSKMKDSDVIKSKYSEIKDKVSEFKNIDSDIKELREKLNILYVREEKVKDNMDDIKYTLKQFEELAEEYEELNLEVRDMEQVMDSLSTRKGAPLVIMNTYLSTTRNIANDLLKDCFGGDLLMLPFNIDESEFVMPLSIGNMINSDIIFASDGQRSLLSTILSFALIKQNSSKYNIMVLDEIDGPLDDYHRKYFISMLESQMRDIGSEQAFLISHNPEFSKYDVDAIILDGRDRKLGDNVNIIYKK